VEAVYVERARANLALEMGPVLALRMEIVHTRRGLWRGDLYNLSVACF
jgi:hypothetical protein